jgi:Endoplasmic Reticulum Oxidoreductin 1 (ERO1)
LSCVATLPLRNELLSSTFLSFVRSPSDLFLLAVHSQLVSLQVPELIRSTDTTEHEFELDGWARWDMPSDDYYDTQVFPESYTGYDGAVVWRFIHSRICFDGYEYDDDHWKADFNKAVSGLHSMVSAQVVRGIREKVTNGEPFGETEVWRDPHVEFARRLSPNGETPLAIENLYFAYMLILTAVAKARDRLLKDCASGKIDGEAAAALRPVLEHPLLDNPSVAVAYRKLHDHAVKDSDSAGALWEARMRSRELLRIMNCVQCNKCRLHGKISVMGLSTALQVLVGRTGEGGDPTRVHRVELAALMTALHKFSTAIKFCEEMMR